ncbi:hypothetical protein [Flexivirga caeni]|uniref:hypothetical protein n=1 Tax=Flexivirga caeni TaxID=2294115 RepID=UPI0013159C08|nr:hypothetical protein [Flexivirga caeni]
MNSSWTVAPWSDIRRSHPVLRYAIYGCATCGVARVLVGTIAGLRIYTPTAWATAAEVGLPAAVFGALAGALAGCVVAVAARARR